jgi:hypothetical protein
MFTFGWLKVGRASGCIYTPGSASVDTKRPKVQMRVLNTGSGSQSKCKCRPTPKPSGPCPAIGGQQQPVSEQVSDSDSGSPDTNFGNSSIGHPWCPKADLVQPVVKALPDPHIRHLHLQSALNRFPSPMHLNDHTFLECCIAQQQCKVQDLTLQLEEANVLLREFKVFDRDAASAQRLKVQQLSFQVEAAKMFLRSYMSNGEFHD